MTLLVFRTSALALISLTLCSSIVQTVNAAIDLSQLAHPSNLDPRHARIYSEYGWASLDRTVLAARQVAKSREASSFRFVVPTLPSKGTPLSGRRQGAASRGQCAAVVGEPLTALVPATWKYLGKQPEKLSLDAWQAVWGLTTSQSPTLWFYNPYSLTSKLPITFVLEDEQGRNIYKTSFAAPGTQPGVVGFRLPSTAQIDVGKKYRWYFSVDCDTVAPALVQGWIQRVAINPHLLSQLQLATPRQRVALYASNGIWYEALTRLAELRAANPKDFVLLNDWISLLDSVGLEAVAHQPLRSTLDKRAQVSKRRG